VALLPHPARAATAAVTIHDYYFMPSSLTISPGTKVDWAYNVGAGTATHTVTFAGFSSGNLNPGSSYSHTFDIPGTYSYYCMYHQNIGMTGTITVTGSSPTPTTHATATPAPTHHSTTQGAVQTMPKPTSTPTRAPTSATPTPTPTRSEAVVVTPTPSPSVSVLAETPNGATKKGSAAWIVLAVIVALAAGAGVLVYSRVSRAG
jgi:plastocyanin